MSSKGQTFTYRFLAYLTWGNPDRQFREGEIGIPEDLLECQASWERMKAAKRFDKKENRRICSIIASHLTAAYVPSNLSNLPNNTTLLSREERTLPNARVFKYDFSAGPIPSICAQVEFDLSFSAPIALDEIGEWCEKNDHLDYAISFGYDFFYADGEYLTAETGHQGLSVQGPL